MEARRLIEGASYGPDTLNILFRAFDEAWTVLAPRYGDDAPAIGAARIRLANILLGLARDEDRDVAALRDVPAMRDAALHLYERAAGGR